jgi:D-sedoheptulose 7-phosphate isomerase
LPLPATVIEAIKVARQLGLFSIGLTGASGGKLLGLVDALIAVPTTETPRIQECHILVGPALCDAVEQALDVSVDRRANNKEVDIS